MKETKILIIIVIVAIVIAAILYLNNTPKINGEEQEPMLIESYNSDVTSQGWGTYDVNQFGQSFTAPKDFTTTSIEIILFKHGSPGTIQMTLWETADELPSVALTYADVDESMIPSGGHEEVVFTFDEKFVLNSGEMYAFTIDDSSDDEFDNYVSSRFTSTSAATYEGGQNLVNLGLWWSNIGQDMSFFEIWGY